VVGKGGFGSRSVLESDLLVARPDEIPAQRSEGSPEYGLKLAVEPASVLASGLHSGFKLRLRICLRLMSLALSLRLALP
jgi:hypothetical protein